ncbi:MAG: hypothetical protein ABIN83_01660 [Sphingomicrobium sp.]
MTSRRDILVMGGSALAGAALPGSTWAKTIGLAEVIRRHTAAIGGAAARDRIHSKRVALTIIEKGDKLEAVYRCSSEPTWRIDIYAGGNHVFCEGLDSKGPWLWGGGPAAKDAVPDAKRTGLQGIEFHLYGLHRFASRGHALSLDAPQTIDGTRYHVIRVKMNEAYETFLFINPRTWLVDRRRDERAPHPDLDSTRKFLETRYSDYRRSSGILTAFEERQVDLTTGALVNSSTVRQVEFNFRPAPGTFDRAWIAA